MNYFDIEKLIVARLEECVKEVKGVFTPLGIRNVMESSQASPILHVIYSGDSIKTGEGSSAGRGAAQMVTQRWTIVLAIRDPHSQLQNTSTIRETAGEIIPKVISALQGWCPDGMGRTLKRVSSPPVGMSPAFCYFPIVFEWTFPSIA